MKFYHQRAAFAVFVIALGVSSLENEVRAATCSVLD
jgi:hypothetical protein